MQYFIHTFGCAMNEYDTERIASAIEKRGYMLAIDPKHADIIIINTCSVREKPQTKIASYLGVIRKYKGKRIIGITGCVAQQEGKNLLSAFDNVNFVMGTEALIRIDDILERAINGERLVDTTFGLTDFTIGDFNRRETVTANVTIMKGCENFCSYCIVPYVRGKELSRRSEDIIDEVKKLVTLGVKEVCLLGQNVNSYGRNLPTDEDFSDLLKKVNKIEGIARIRFVTSHPKDLNEKMIYTIAESEKVCNYIHLPIQSGSDNVLKAMNRGYTVKEYLDKVDLARKVIEGVSFSSDFITGFPNETEADFAATLNVIREVKYDHIFAFNYSPRPNTKALELGDNNSYDVKNARLTRLLQVKDEVMDAILPTLIGQDMEILVTGRSKKDEQLFTGCNQSNRNVNFSADRDINAGEVVKVKIFEAKRHSLKGVLC